ncbi:MAG: AtpZ/AtpI family protein [Lacipirellulaceae bacterium]
MADDSQTPLAKAYGLASQCVTIVLGMAIPGLFGHVLDRWLGTAPLLLAVGFALGFPLGVWRLLVIAKERGSAPVKVRKRRGRQDPGSSDG